MTRFLPPPLRALVLDERLRTMSRVLMPWSWRSKLLDALLSLLVLGLCIAGLVRSARPALSLGSYAGWMAELTAYQRLLHESLAQRRFFGGLFDEDTCGMVLLMGAVMWLLTAGRVWWAFFRLRARMDELFLTPLTAVEWARVIYSQALRRWLLVMWPLLACAVFAFGGLAIWAVGAPQEAKTRFFDSPDGHTWVAMTAIVFLAVLWSFPQAVRSGWIAWRGNVLLPFMDGALSLVAGFMLIFVPVLTNELFSHSHSPDIATWKVMVVAVLLVGAYCSWLGWRSVQGVVRGLRCLPMERRDSVPRWWGAAEWRVLAQPGLLQRWREISRSLSSSSIVRAWLLAGMWTAVVALLSILVGLVRGVQFGILVSMSPLAFCGPLGVLVFGAYVVHCRARQWKYANPAPRAFVEHPPGLVAVLAALRFGFPLLLFNAFLVVVRYYAVSRDSLGEWLSMGVIPPNVFVISWLLYAIVAANQFSQKHQTFRSVLVHVAVIFTLAMAFHETSNHYTSSTNRFWGGWFGLSDEMLILLTIMHLSLGLVLIALPACGQAYNSAIDAEDTPQ